MFQNCHCGSFIYTIFVHIKLPQLGSGNRIFFRCYHLTLSFFELIANHTFNKCRGILPNGLSGWPLRTC